MSFETILISGVGIAGATLAYWLKAAGFAPTLVEHAPALRAGGFVIDFWGLGYDLAELMSLADCIERAGYHIRELRLVDSRGERVAGFGTRVLGELTGGRFVTLARGDLARLLFEKIRGGTEIIFGDEIVGLDEHTGGMRVRFKHRRQRTFDLVIGADGLHSRVRELSFGSQERFEKRLGYAVAAFEAAGYRPRDEDVYVIFSEPGRMLGRVALHGDRTLFLFVFAAADAVATIVDPLAQKAMLRRTYDDGRWECARILDELDRTEDLYFDQVNQIRMETWSRGRVALVGDAAFCVSLMVGQGAALAMTAAYVLAGELAAADGPHDQAFRNYERRLRNFIGAKQKGAERFFRCLCAEEPMGIVPAQSD